MSVKALSWAFDQRIRGNLKLLLLVLADSHSDGLGCFPNIDTLIRKVCISRKTYDRLIVQLKKRKYVERSARFTDSGRRTSNEFKLNMALCPAHEDSAPSLRITDGGDRVLLCCYAGCRTTDVLTACGLDWVDAFECMQRPPAQRRERLTSRDLKGYAHTLQDELTSMRAETFGTDFTDERKRIALEHAKVRLTRFAERYGVGVLAAVVKLHQEIYWSESNEY